MRPATLATMASATAVRRDPPEPSTIASWRAALHSSDTPSRSRRTNAGRKSSRSTTAHPMDGPGVGPPGRSKQDSVSRLRKATNVAGVSAPRPSSLTRGVVAAMCAARTASQRGVRRAVNSRSAPPLATDLTRHALIRTQRSTVTCVLAPGSTGQLPHPVPSHAETTGASTTVPRLPWRDPLSSVRCL